jgi:hypothetical protein
VEAVWGPMLSLEVWLTIEVLAVAALTCRKDLLVVVSLFALSYKEVVSEWSTAYLS